MYSVYSTPQYSPPPSEGNGFIYFLVFIVIVIIILCIILYKRLNPPKPPSPEETKKKCDKMMEKHTERTPEEDVFWYLENCNGDKDDGEKCKRLYTKSKNTQLSYDDNQWYRDKCTRPYP